MSEPDHDILIRLDEGMCWMKKTMGNHLKHHWMITLYMFGSALALLSAFVLMYLKGKGG